MRAVWYESGGPAAEVLQIGELEAPQPGEGEVRVKIAYSSVNHFDIKKRVHGAELANWDRVVPHVDGSGEIESVGSGVSESRVGERFGSNADLNSRVLARGGTISAYGVDDAPTPEIPARRLMMKNANCRFVGIFVLNRKRLSALFEQANQIAVAPGFEFRIGAEVSLDEVATLHQRVEDGAVPGAALIRI